MFLIAATAIAMFYSCYARSPEFLQTGTIETFRWLRVVGDTVFAAGALALAIFVIRLRTRRSSPRLRIGVPAPRTEPMRQRVNILS
jgi:nitric oxide reductase large subunit